jgi:hypothetical protein
VHTTQPPLVTNVLRYCCCIPLCHVLPQFTAPPPPHVAFEEFANAYGLAYDYDNIWITDTNNVVTGASYSGSVRLQRSVVTPFVITHMLCVMCAYAACAVESLAAARGSRQQHHPQEDEQQQQPQPGPPAAGLPVVATNTALC